MRVRAISGSPAEVTADVLAVPIYRDDADLAGDLAELDAASGGAIRRAIEWGEFNLLEHACALVDAGDLPVEHLLLLNGGVRGRGLPLPVLAMEQEPPSLVPAAPVPAQAQPHALPIEPGEPGAEQGRGLERFREHPPARAHEGRLPEPVRPGA